MEELTGTIGFTGTFRQGFALFAGQNLTQFIFTGDQFVTNGHQYRVTLFQTGQCPLLLTFFCSGDSGFGLCFIGLGVVADGVTQVSRADVRDCTLGTVYPLTCDIVFEYVVGHFASPPEVVACILGGDYK